MLLRDARVGVGEVSDDDIARVSFMLAQCRAEDAPDDKVLHADEFMEAVARLAAKVYAEPIANGASTVDDALERLVHRLLTLVKLHRLRIPRVAGFAKLRRVSQALGFCRAGLAQSIRDLAASSAHRL